MVGWELYMEIRILRAQGHSLRAIARETGLAVNTVRKYLERPDPPRYGPRRQRPGKRDPFRAYLMERIQAALPDRLSATVLHREVKALGYTGQVRWLRQMIAELRPKSPPEPLIRFETPPGKQLQADWAVFRRGRDPLVGFVATLGYSRAGYVQFADNARLETLLMMLEASFRYFHGVTHEVLFDNMKTVVLTRDHYGPGQHRFQPGLWDMARHYGFTPRLCRPYRAKTKGKVERFIRYVRSSFYVPLASALRPAGLVVDVATANVEARRWLTEVANARVHGTTGTVPAERLIAERAALLPLPRPYQPVIRAIGKLPPHRYPVVPPQHDLRRYDQLLGARP